MKIRFKVDSLPNPKTLYEHIACLIVERLDILCRVLIQRLSK